MSVYIVNAACNWGLEVSASPDSVCLLRHENKQTVSVCLKCGEIYGEAFNKTLIELGRYKTPEAAVKAKGKLINAFKKNMEYFFMPLEDEES